MHNPTEHCHSTQGKLTNTSFDGMEEYQLTILTPTLNCGSTISETLCSVEELSSLMPNKIQHLIGDAGSKDGTIAVANAYAERHNWAKVQSCENRSIPETLNILLRSTMGTWVLVLNGDDAVYPVKLAALLTESIDIDSADIVCGNVDVCTVEGKKVGSRHCRISKLNSYMSVNHPSMLVRQRIFSLVGNYPDAAPTAYDYIWTWQAYRSHVMFRCVDVTLSKARLGGISQVRANKGAKEILEYKMAHSARWSAILNYGSFRFKEFIRAVLPAALVKVLVKQYRSLNNSVDHY